jgi:hypothetical protein
VSLFFPERGISTHRWVQLGFKFSFQFACRHRLTRGQEDLSPGSAGFTAGPTTKRRFIVLLTSSSARNARILMPMFLCMIDRNTDYVFLRLAVVLAFVLLASAQVLFVSFCVLFNNSIIFFVKFRVLKSSGTFLLEFNASPRYL